jgi:hypothetical protein
VCGGQLSSCDCPYSAETARVPFIEWPQVCARCGEVWPDFFRVPNEEWCHYVQLDRQREVVCLPCYETIQHWIDTGPAQPPSTGFTR